jgi:hypothetical protein
LGPSIAPLRFPLYRYPAKYGFDTTRADVTCRAPIAPGSAQRPPAERLYPLPLTVDGVFHHPKNPTICPIERNVPGTGESVVRRYLYDASSPALRESYRYGVFAPANA